MFFCPNCDNLFDIAKNPPTRPLQGGGENKDLEKMEQNLKAEEEQEKEKEKEQEQKQNENQIVGGARQDVKTAYFICKSCGYSEPMKTGTVIVRRITEAEHESADTSVYKDMINAKELPYTRNYICPNKSCKTHTHPERKEAQFFRTDNYKVKYICNECKTLWNLN